MRKGTDKDNMPSMPATEMVKIDKAYLDELAISDMEKRLIEEVNKQIIEKAKEEKSVIEEESISQVEEIEEKKVKSVVISKQNLPAKKQVE